MNVSVWQCAQQVLVSPYVANKAQSAMALQIVLYFGRHGFWVDSAVDYAVDSGVDYAVDSVVDFAVDSAVAVVVLVVGVDHLVNPR